MSVLLFAISCVFAAHLLDSLFLNLTADTVVPVPLSSRFIFTVFQLFVSWTLIDVSLLADRRHRCNERIGICHFTNNPQHSIVHG
jgi:hypothetical protein